MYKNTNFHKYSQYTDNFGPYPILESFQRTFTESWILYSIIVLRVTSKRKENQAEPLNIFDE